MIKLDIILIILGGLIRPRQPPGRLRPLLPPSIQLLGSWKEGGGVKLAGGGVIERENHYFKLLKPDYNISQEASEAPSGGFASLLRRMLLDVRPKTFWGNQENIKCFWCG
uniref:Uncharacterized protein n=1 Tax=Morchella brunnea TaxID=1174671 RepID=A0A8K1I8D0_9PEZI|nr:hypothetical protein LK370_mgp028 [Morchella brunnea]UBU98602.1 hypothetical protein [Morchella brunnea]